MIGNLLAFRGHLARLPYFLGAAGLLLAQYALVWLLFAALDAVPGGDFWWLPLRALVQLRGVPALVFPAVFFLSLLIAWMLAALSFRRAMDAGISGLVSALTIVPMLQLAAIPVLAVFPTRPAASPPKVEGDGLDWRVAIQGVLAGMGLTVFSVAVSALLFGSYGFGMFVAAPLIIGAVTGFLASRTRKASAGATMLMATVALALGGVTLVILALEGIVCILLASPLAWFAAMVGAAIGRAMSPGSWKRDALMGVSFLPLIFAAEAAMPPRIVFDTTETIEVRAGAPAVWRALTDMGVIEPQPALPYRLGLGYPVRGEIIGEGVGAIRKGVFSTGTALERVTEWQPNRKLAFTVQSSPPAVVELSPYRHVHAPHVKGYFNTSYTSFEIVPTARGSRIVERTSHELRLDPILYWMPFARWIIHENNMRVLNHVRRRAETFAQSSS